MKAPDSWVLLIFTLPREPSAPRVAIWRKLKKLGAALLHDAVWVLPATPPLLERLRWLATDIQETGGEALVWVASQGLPGQDEALLAKFLAQAEEEYQAISAALDEPHPDVVALGRRYRRTRAIDYFRVPSGDAVRVRLEGLESGEDSDTRGYEA